MVEKKDKNKIITGENRAFREIYPFDSHYYSIGGNNIHYIDEGQGEPVIMLHGNPTWSFLYRRLAGDLRDIKRVIVPDHMGCGFSDKPQDYPYTLRVHIDNLEKLLSFLEIKKASMVVHDWGGAIGFGYAVRHPEKINRIVILNTAAFFSERIPFFIRLCRIPWFSDIAVRGLNAFLKSSLRMAVNYPERITPAIRDGYLLPYNSWKNRIANLRFVQDIPHSEKDDSYIVLKEMEEKLSLLKERHVLIQWGALDWCFNMSFLEKWRDIFPAAEIDVYEDASHYLLEDAHEKVIPRIREFLK